MSQTFHLPFSAKHDFHSLCSKTAYEAYRGDRFKSSLLDQDVTVIAVKVNKAIPGEDGHDYHHILMVLSREDISSRLPELFPLIPGEWEHNTQA